MISSQNRNKIFRIFVLFGIFISSILLSLRYVQQSNNGFSILVQPNSYDQLTIKNKGELHKGDLVTGEFKSKFDYLGIVAVRFKIFNRINEDKLFFRIKEKNASKWYFQSEINTDQFQPNELFPFGFPIINNSKDKTYYLEIESAQGATNSAVAIHPIYPTFVAKSQYPLNHLFSDRSKFINFVFNKIVNLFSDPDFIRQSIIFGFPVVFYLSLFFFNDSFYPSLLTILSAGLVNVFVLVNVSLYLLCAAAITSMFMLFRYKMESRFAALLGLIFLSLSSVALVLQLDHVVEKSAVWTYLFFIILAAKLSYDVIRIPKMLVSVDRIWTDLSQLLRTFIELVLILFIDDSAWESAIKMPANPKISIEKWNSIRRIARYLSFVLRCFIFFWLTWLITKNVTNYINFYFDSFPDKQIENFLQNTAIYLLISYLLISLPFVKYLSKSKLGNSVSALILFLFVILMSWNKIFDITTTTFRDHIDIWSYSPQKATLWDEVHVYGRNFGDMPFSGKITVSGVEHRILKWTNKEIVFQAEPGKTKSGNLVITSNDGKKSGSIKINYYDFFTKKIVK